jgi:hypothetical protein
VPFEGATFSHIGIVTPDIMKTAQVFADLYGVTVPEPGIYDNRGEGLAVPAGANWNKAARARTTRFAVAGTFIELLEPIDGPSPWADHLEKYGMSVHHIAWRPKGVEQARLALLKQGGKWVMGSGGENMAYVDMRDVVGVTIEVQPPAGPGAPAPPSDLR